MNPVVIVHPKLAQASFERAIRPLLTHKGRYGELGIHLRSFTYPFLDVDFDWHARGHAVRLRIDGTDYPYRPVSGYWIDEHNGRLLPGRGIVPGNGGGGFQSSGLDGSPRCWFCFKGWREYHDHPSHQDTSWATLRSNGSYTVMQLIQQLSWDLNNAPGVTPV
nr:hypothetical protein [uncultured Albidiferax sp.]